VKRMAAYGILLLCLFLFPWVPIGAYQMHLLILAAIFSVMTLSLNLITGYVGELSLGHAAFFGIGAFTSALLSLRGNFSFWLSLPAAGIMAGLLGLGIGYVTLRLRGAYFVIVTLAFAEIIELVDINWVSLTNGPMGLTDIPLPQIFVPRLGLIIFSSKLHFFYLSLVFLILVIYACYRLVNSRIGRAWISIRENEPLAQSVGVSAFKYALLAFVIGSVFTGMAGSIYAHYMSFIGPEVFGFSLTIDMLIMLITGGTGTISGPVIGALIFTALPEYLRVAQLYRLSIFGIILILAVMFFPQGIVPVSGQLLTYIRERSKSRWLSLKHVH
jgi:branched-chain amino acid transport system permease protein